MKSTTKEEIVFDFISNSDDVIIVSDDCDRKFQGDIDIPGSFVLPHDTYHPRAPLLTKMLMEVMSRVLLDDGSRLHYVCFDIDRKVCLIMLPLTHCRTILLGLIIFLICQKYGVWLKEKWLEKLGPANNKRTKSHGDPFLQSVYLDILKKSL